MRAALDAASGGRGGIVLVAGEPGIGKSALAEATARTASDQGFRALWGSCWDGDGAPAYWPWMQVVRAYAHERTPADLLAVMGDAAPLIARIVPELAARFLALPDAPDEPDAERARFRLFDGVGAFLRNAASETPLLVVIDDVHWADHASLLLLRFLSRALRDSAVLVLGTYRDVEVDAGHPLALVLAEHGTERIALTGLAQSDVARLIAQTTGADVGDGLAGAVHDRTVGNPFFVKEIARLLDAQGRLADTGAAVRWSLPEGVRDVIGRRLARVSESCVSVLSAASVLGAEFRVDVLERVVGIERGTLLESIDEALAARLLNEPADAIGRYAFAHALVRDVLYDGLGATKRASLHRVAGETLESLFSPSIDAHAAEIAYHFVRALPGGDAAKAASYSARAGANALSLYAYDDAVAHFRRALEVLALQPGDPRQRIRVQLHLADALTRAGDLPSARSTYLEAATLARDANDVEALSHAALGLGTGLGGFEVRMFDDAQIGLLKEALHRLPAEDSALRAWLSSRLSVAQSFVEPVEARARLARDAVEMARRVGDPTALAYSLSALCDALSGPADVEERLDAAAEIVRLAEEIRSSACGVPSCTTCLCDPEMSLLGRRFLLVGHLERGDLAAVDHDVDAYARIAEHLRQPLYQWYVPLWRGMRALLAARFDEAEAFGLEADRIGTSAHSKNATMLVLTQRVAMARARDDRGALAGAWDAAMEAVPELMSTELGKIAQLWAEIARGNDRGARAILASIDVTAMPADSEYLSSLASFAEAMWLLDEPAHAQRVYDAMRPFEDLLVVDGIGASVIGSVSHSLGQLASLLGRPADAERHFGHALASYEQLGSPWLTTRAQRDRDAARARGAVVAGLAGTFRRDGEVWTVGLSESTVTMKDSKGLRDIATLLARPGVEVHAADLVAPRAAKPARANGDAPAMREGDTGPVLDDAARAAYKRRLAELEDEIRDADDANDTARASRARDSMDFIASELASAYGLGGRARKTGDPGERARKAVTERIRDAVNRIEKAHPELGRHLRRSIRTGTFCSYEPDERVAWTL